THRDLKTEVHAGRFREDLFFRLNVVRIDVPPLRDRADDIPLLAEACLRNLVKEGGVRGTRFAPTAVELLVRHPWPGNVRELENVVAHAALMAKSEEIQQSDLPLELTAAKEWLAALDRLLPAKSPLDATLTAIERHLVHRALAQSNGVQAKAAEILGISRSLLQYKLKVLGEPEKPAT
ncbi:MAG: sigma-54-dependent Fis family transcriptional regulator, partial [Nitrospirae bacterium]